MPRLSFGQLSLVLVAFSAVALLVVGTRDLPAMPLPAPSPTSLAAGGLLLTSTSVELPAETAEFPAIEGGPGADAVNANCISCHSASMAMNQPRLSAAQWTETVTKMRDVFKAPIATRDTAAIVAYLAAMSAALPSNDAGGAAEAAAGG